MASLQQAIDVLDPSHDKTTEITLALSLLTELCEEKVKAFEAAVKEQLHEPATYQFIASLKEYRAYTKRDAGKVATEVADATRKFISGPTQIVDGIATLITDGLETIIGAATGQQEWVHYFIVTEARGTMRYDVRAWARKIEATAITSQIENALALGAFKSSIDVKTISLNTFLSAYSAQLEAMQVPRDKQAEYLAAARTTFENARKS